MITKLSWDSSFFGFEVYRIDAIENGIDLNESILNAKEKGANLIYFFSEKSPAQELLYILNQFHAKHVDKKITYEKPLIAKPLISYDSMSIVDVDLFNRYKIQLFQLAYLSGTYSRYNTDNKIRKDKFRELYELWIVNAFEKKYGDMIMIEHEDLLLRGFVSLDLKAEYANIGLIAVQPEFQGKSIGKKLMSYAEKVAIDHKKKIIRVPTQEANQNACLFYEKLGYKKISEEYIYHIWLK